MNTMILSFSRNGELEKKTIVKGLEELLKSYNYYTKDLKRWDITIIENGFQVYDDDENLYEEYTITMEELR